ncbi:somatostatin receptor type 4-like [Amphiura filiformis]|uniref:somatostatin receptor type 4-like n=1 Tax=Amphiura filiformis TaxID=82378 RepID=UPI003B20DFEC
MLNSSEVDTQNETNAGVVAPPRDIVKLILQLYVPIFIGTIGIIGNGFVCFVIIYRYKYFNSFTNRLILNQSVLDLASSVIFLLQRFAPRPGPSAPALWIDLVCRIWGTEFFLWALTKASTYNLIVISLERYLAVCHVIWHRNVFTQERATILSISVYFLGALFMLYAPFYANKDYGCYVVWDNRKAQVIFGIFTFVHTYFFPLCVIVFCYVNIWTHLRNREVARIDNQAAGGAQFGHAKKNVTITLLIVAIAFVLLWTPSSVTYALYNFGFPYDLTTDLHAVFLTLVLCNMTVNPIVYSFKYHEFRRQLKFIFRPSRRVGDVPSQLTTSST